MLTKPQSSRRTRITASVAAAALGLVSMGLATGIADAAVADPVPAANTNLDAQCGLDIGLILDGSGSIGNPGKGTSQNPISAVPDVKAAAKALLSPLTDTNTNAGIITFSTVMKTDADVTMQPLTGGAYTGTFVPEIDAYSSGGYTNWDIALRTAKQRFIDSAANRPGVPDLIIFITDGAPNTIGGAIGQTVTDAPGTANDVTGGQFSDASAGAVNPAITAANAIKNSVDSEGLKPHMLTIGAGQAFNNNANAVNYRTALAKVSGGGGTFGGGSASAVFDAFDPDNVLTAAEKGVSKYTTQSPLNLSTADVVLVKSFADLGTQLGEIANKLCGGSLIVQKQVSTPENPNTYSAATSPWQFNATPGAANASYSWVQPTVSDSDTNQTGTTSGALAATTFQWKITNASNWNSNKNIAIDEEEQANYVFDSVACTKKVPGQSDADVSVTGVNTGTGQFSVPVGAADIVTCVVKNKAQKRVDLELDKTILGSAPYSVDTNRTWKLSVTNKGPSAATGVEVKDYLPTGFDGPYSYAPNSGVSLNGSTVTWAVGSLAVNETKTLEITGTLTSTGPMTNWAQVTGANETDVDSTPNNCTINAGVLGNAEDDCDKVTINVTRDYNLDIDKVRVGSGAVGVGDQVQYDLKVTNNGESTSASGFVVTDQVNAGLTNVSVSPNAPGAANWSCAAVVNNLVSCTYNASLAKGAAAVSVRVTATVGAALANAESVPNTACVKKGANATVNDDCDDEIIDLTPRSDLEITKKSVPDPSVVVTGSNASWKYSVKNLGPSVKKLPFTVTDTLPNNLTNVTITPGAGWSSCSATNIAGPTSGSTFTCTYTPGVNGLAVNDSTSDVTLTASTVNVVPAQGSTSKLENKACVEDNYNETTTKTGSLQGPNDCSTATVTVTPKVDLQMNKSAQASADATVGSTITYNFSVTNNGPSTATSFSFQDTFDAGLVPTLVSDGDWDCSLNGQNLSCDWDGDPLANGATTAPPVVVTAVVQASLADAANVKNTACIAEDDIKGDENRDAVNVTGADCDTTTTDLDPKFALVIDKDQVEENPVAVGGTVTYDLTVYNQGPSKATSGFVVSDTVPSLLDVTAVTPSSADWNCTASSGNVVSCTWEGEDLAVGAAPVITVTATVTQDAANADAVFNTACVAKDGQQEGIKRLSLVIDEEQEVLTECDTVTTEFPKGDISVGKAAYLNDDETVNDEGTTLDGFGGTITYVLGASASGNLDQTNVVVTDTVPTIGNPAGNELNTTLVPGSVVCVDGPNGATNAVIPCAGAVDSTPNDLSWNVGTVTAGTTKWVEFKVTVDVPSVGDVDTDATSFNVRNVGAVTSDYTEEPVPSNPVDTPVAVSRVIPNKAGDCIDDTPVFGVDGTGFYAGETVKMRVFDKDGNLVSDEYANAQADANGDVSFEDILWPGFSVEQPGNIKTYPGPQFSNIQVELYGSPTSNRVTIGYPPAESGCTAALEIVKSNNPTKDVTITEFGAEITYTMDITAPEQNVYNSEDVVVTDVLPGYGTLTSGTVTYKDGSATCDATIPELGADSICDASFVPNTVTWNLGDMRPGDTRQVSFVVTVDEQGTPNADDVVEFTIQNVASADSLYTDPTDSNVVENPVSVNVGTTEEETPGTTPEPQVKGVKLPKTGLEIPVGTLMALGIALVGTGIVLGMTARRRDENGEQI